MKARVNRDGCIGCGLCVSTCPEVFRMADDGMAEVYVEEVPPEQEKAASEAREDCPVSVIDLS